MDDVKVLRRYLSTEPLPTQGRLLALLVAATFLVFFQAFMIAPLIPRLAQVFDSSTGLVATAVPAYLIPYGAATLARRYGVQSLPTLLVFRDGKRSRRLDGLITDDVLEAALARG